MSTFSDGTRLEDLQAAIQAAALASNVDLAAEIAKRYGVYGHVCLYCGWPEVPPTDGPRPDLRPFHLCALCVRCVNLPKDVVYATQCVLNVYGQAPIVADGHFGPETFLRLWNRR